MSSRQAKNPLVPVLLTQVRTSDGLDLAGVVVEPRRSRGVALVWMHGLTSSFERGQVLMSELSRYCQQHSVGYFKFNTRGHHLVDRGVRRSQRLPFVGATHERFQDCVRDIRAVIQLAKRRGYRRIILAGHSTGASKALYYAVRAKDPSIMAVILAGPASDIAGELKDVGRATLLRRVTQAKRRSVHHPHELVPAAWGPWTNARYVSLFARGSVEDVFPYHQLGGRWSLLRRVRVPVLMISGQRDQYLTRPAKEVMNLFAATAVSTKHFTGVVIPRADHGFAGYQAAVIRAIDTWLTATL